MNLFSASIREYLTIVTVIFLVMLPLILMDKFVFKKNNGVDGVAIWNAGMSIGNPAAIALAFPALFGDQVQSATAIVAMVCIIIHLISSLHKMSSAKSINK